MTAPLSKAARRRRNAAARRETEQSTTPTHALGIERVRAASTAAPAAASALKGSLAELAQGPVVAPVDTAVDRPAIRPRRVVCPDCYSEISPRSRDGRCTSCRERLGRRSRRRGRPTDAEITERAGWSA